MSATTSMNKSEFARHIGVSRARIRHLVGKGLPTDKGGNIPVAKAKAWIKDNVDPIRKNHWGQGSNDSGGTLAKIRKRQIGIKTAQAELQLRRELGNVVHREMADRHVAKLAQAFQDALANWPAKLAAEVAAGIGADPRKTLTVMEREVRRLREEVARHRVEIS